MTFEAFAASDGYKVQLSRSGELLAADWVESTTDLLARCQKVRNIMDGMTAGSSAAQLSVDADASGALWRRHDMALPASVAAAMRR